MVEEALYTENVDIIDDDKVYRIIVPTLDPFTLKTKQTVGQHFFGEKVGKFVFSLLTNRGSSLFALCMFSLVRGCQQIPHFLIPHFRASDKK